jgi:hypothetical protein
MTTGHLRKTASGHLARVTNGHLRRCPGILRCGCPGLPYTLYVTFAGQGGGFAGYNGKTGLDNYDPPAGCWWGKHSGSLPLLYVTPTLSGWHLLLYVAEGLWQTWDRTCDPCDPAGAYTRTGCAPTADCNASSGATCVVSLT